MLKNPGCTSVPNWSSSVLQTSVRKMKRKQTVGGVHKEVMAWLQTKDVGKPLNLIVYLKGLAALCYRGTRYNQADSRAKTSCALDPQSCVYIVHEGMYPSVVLFARSLHLEVQLLNLSTCCIRLI